MTPEELLVRAPDSHWRTVQPDLLLDVALTTGHVLIELACAFAPVSVARLQTLVRERQFDGAPIARVQDNHVAQWGDLAAREPGLPPEFVRTIDTHATFVSMPDPDTYAPATGFIDGFPVARDAGTGEEWLVHCYGMVGVGRSTDIHSGTGAVLYTVIGQAPRHLDRNATLVGRVVAGMPHLSTLPRGHGPLGFYCEGQSPPVIRSIRLAIDLPAGERASIQVLRTQSPTFRTWLEARRTRTDPWFCVTGGRLDVCSVSIPQREGSRWMAPVST
jgi:cyclophilin family peptidyl-prolyl cis-trans isomerase